MQWFKCFTYRSLYSQREKPLKLLLFYTRKIDRPLIHLYRSTGCSWNPCIHWAGPGPCCDWLFDRLMSCGREVPNFEEKRPRKIKIPFTYTNTKNTEVLYLIYYRGGLIMMFDMIFDGMIWCRCLKVFILHPFAPSKSISSPRGGRGSIEPNRWQISTIQGNL